MNAEPARAQWPLPLSRGAGRQRGVALITVLLVVALATTAAASMTGRHQFDLRRTANRLALAQAHQVALGGEAWAMGILARDRRGQRADGTEIEGERDQAIDSRDEDWAQPLPPIPIEGGQVTGRITDAQSRFNINNLIAAEPPEVGNPSDAGESVAAVDAVAVGRFERLLEGLELDPEIARAVIDWLDPDSETSYPGGAEDDYYAALDRPYRAANRRLETASELRLVRGIDAAAWRRLEPHVTALPRRTAINVNTASAPVLRAVVPTLEDGQAEQLVELAGEEPFESLVDFRGHPLVSDPDVDASGLAVGTRHFRVRTDVQVGSIEYTLYSWLAREDTGGSRVVRRARTPN